MKKQNPFVIGTDVGGTNLRVALVDQQGRIIRKTKRPVPADNIVDEIISAIEETAGSDVFEAIGLGVAGVVDKSSGTVIRSPNLPQINGVPLVKVLEERFSVNVFIENDANAHAQGEAWIGAGADFKSFVLLTLGTGIGGGVVINGKVLDMAAELGHVTLDANGPQCACGNTGCLEAYASASAVVNYVIEAMEHSERSILRQIHHGNIYRITAEDVYRAALDDDSLARTAIKRAGKYLGIAVASFVNIFSPEAVIIGGGLSGAWELLAPEMIKEMERRAFPELAAKVKIRRAKLTDDAGLIGSARLAFILKK